MLILEKTTTPQGVPIQLEQWDSGLTIGAYPIAKNGGYWTRSGEQFRLTISNNRYMNYSDDNVKADFEALKSGVKRFEDLAKHFWNGKKDQYYLGMISIFDLKMAL